MAAARGIVCVTVQTVARHDTLQDRLRRRAKSGDASEADIEVLRHQVDEADPLEAGEMDRALVVSTEEHVDAAALAARIRELR